MMEENNHIFLAGGDALVYLIGPMHKKYSTTFVWYHPFSTYVSYDQFFKPPIPFPSTAITLSNSSNNNDNSIKQAL